MRFDPSGMNQAFDRMQSASRSKGHDFADGQSKFFLRMVKKLGWKIAPTYQGLDAVYQKLKGRLKRKKGTTSLQELARRKAARGTFARGWQIGRVENSGLRIRIWIINEEKAAGIVEDKFHVAATAANVVGDNFKSKLERMAKQVTGVF